MHSPTSQEAENQINTVEILKIGAPIGSIPNFLDSIIRKIAHDAGATTKQLQRPSWDVRKTKDNRENIKKPEEKRIITYNVRICGWSDSVREAFEILLAKNNYSVRSKKLPTILQFPQAKDYTMNTADELGEAI